VVYWVAVNVLDYLVIARAKFQQRNECRHARGVEVSCLCNGDSIFDHVPMDSPSIPRLAVTHQKTSTLHSLPKRGVVVWRSGMWGIGILMCPQIYFAAWPALIT
jgi:hypothetical protein